MPRIEAVAAHVEAQRLVAGATEHVLARLRAGEGEVRDDTRLGRDVVARIDELPARRLDVGFGPRRADGQHQKQGGTSRAPDPPSRSTSERQSHTHLLSA